MNKIKLIGVGAIILSVVTFLYVQYSSVKPNFYSVDEIVANEGIVNADQVVGDASVASLLYIIDTLLNKNGGYHSNDILVKLGLYDNMPNFEKGALFQARDLANAIRDEMSRSQSQSSEDESLKLAAPFLSFTHNQWNILASTESSYEKSAVKFRDYLTRLADTSKNNAQFYSRADNLIYYFKLVEKRMGSLSKRLSASVGQERVNTDLANDANAKQSTYASSEVSVKTPWLEIDDVFYESQGSTWALIHFLKAIEVDFASVLSDKNALVSLQQVIRDLESTQETLWSPMILNGDGFGFVANHSLAMANYISRANAALIDIRSLIDQG
jgi:hypothetical protein